MGRIMSIDYGTKRCGIAVSDPLKIIANGLDTVPTSSLLDFIADYTKQEPVECVVIGQPLTKNNEPGKIEHLIVGFIRKLKEIYPDVTIKRVDERFTSKEAASIILKSGVNKKKRKEKGLVDKVSATLILQDYMESIR